MIRPLVLSILLVTSPTRADNSASSATLPLEQLLRLHQQLNEAQKPPGTPPPVSGNVSKLELSGRLFDEGAELTAHFEVRIFSNGTWVSVPLLRLDPQMNLTALPALEDAAVVKEGEKLAMVSKKAGIYAFDVSLILEAQKEKRRRKIQVVYPAAILASMRVQLDESLFRVIAPRGQREQDSLVLYPKQNTFSLEWEQLMPLAAVVTTTTRPPMQPLVERVYAEIVSTLEGQVIERVLYNFRCEGSQRFQVELPEGARVEKVFLNGSSLSFAVRERTVELSLEPTRAGDQSGKLELVLVQEFEPYHLSGRLRFSVPQASWPINEMFLQLHLPSVFQYKRSGGSMEQTEVQPAVQFSEKIPTPGKELAFHQFLIASSSPAVQLAYDIELSGNYFH
jgi:hypothetical protein